MDVSGYGRVSTDEQAVEGASLEVQEGKIRMYCTLHALNLVKIVLDAGESGKDIRRPGIQEVFALLDSERVQGVVVSKLDRLSRSIMNWGWLVEHYFGERAGKQLFSVNDSIDTRTAAGRLSLNVLMSVYQWEREAIAERVRDAHAFNRARGQLCGHAPYGQHARIGGRLTKHGNAADLEVDPSEAEVLVLILSLRDQGRSYRAIAEHLTSISIPTKQRRKGRAENHPWQAGTIHALVKRHSPDGKAQDNTQQCPKPDGRIEDDHQRG